MGNKEAVTKLQESKGFKPSNIKDRKAKREELYDDFVDKYTKIESNDYTKVDSSVSRKTTRRILIVVIILAFAVGIVAGISALNTINDSSSSNITVSDSAFSPNGTVMNASNLTANNNTTQNITKTTTTKKTYSNSATKKNSGSSSNKNSTSGSSSSSSSGSTSSNKHNSSR
ncbi:hypothetical protein [Methanosphaera sp. WGK6]|uniref:hypothetical protein n=1 Tax=Methanosphaera sp. WGK6 TaxID=1561964 RepID=UPI00084CD02A|nr:hypothetical protein [Methanosphaera sp. WGK6]OED29963.1 hypothetical protein NL43_05275 [Methanosphaera sp. WGK6]